MITPDIIHALHSLKEDAAHAWKMALTGDDSGLHALGASIRRFEQEVQRADVIRTRIEDRR